MDQNADHFATQRPERASNSPRKRRARRRPGVERLEPRLLLSGGLETPVQLRGWEVEAMPPPPPGVAGDERCAPGPVDAEVREDPGAGSPRGPILSLTPPVPLVELVGDPDQWATGISLGELVASIDVDMIADMVSRMRERALDLSPPPPDPHVEFGPQADAFPTSPHALAIEDLAPPDFEVDGFPTLPGPMFSWSTQTWMEFSGLEGIGDAPYPLVFEHTGDNDHLAGSQALPTGITTLTRGRLAEGDPVDLYRLPIDPAALAVQIDITVGHGGGDGRLHLVFFDALLQQMGRVKIAGDGDSLTLNLQHPDAPKGPWIYLGVAADWASDPATATPTATGQPPQTGDYTFRVTQQLASDSTTPPGSPLIDPPGSGNVPYTPPPDQGGGQAPTEMATPGSTAGVTPSAPVDLGDEFLAIVLGSTGVATGPLPTRSSAPLGGRLEEGDPAPTVDRSDVALAEGTAAEGETEAAEVAAGDEETEPIETGEALDLIRAAGGFPLLATALVATPPEGARPASDGTPGPPTSAVPPWEFAVEPGPPAAGAVGASSACGASTEAEETSRSPRIRLAVTVGLHLTASCLVALALPELTGTRRPPHRRGTLRRLRDRLLGR